MLRPARLSHPRRSHRRARLIGAAALGALASVALAATSVSTRGERTAQTVEFPAAVIRRMVRHTPPPTVPADPTNRVADSPLAAALGQRLFFETRLSPAGISCTTCHDPQRAFTDGREVARGIGDSMRNAPTLLNAAHKRWLQWDGGADSLWSQALRPMEHPDEMGGDRLSIARLVATDPTLRGPYEELFGPLPGPLRDPTRNGGKDRLPPRARPPLAEVLGPPPPGQPARSSADDPLAEAWAQIAADDRRAIDTVFANVGKALAAHQRRLVTGPTPFDRFAASLGVDGGSSERDALSLAAQRGALLFFGRANCWQCHTGPIFSDGEFHSVGMPPRAGGMPRDPGRFHGIETVMADPFNAAGLHSDAPDGDAGQLVRSLRHSPTTWGEFRTPGLREVARTAPYMHQGQVATLREVVEFYSTLERMLRIGHQHETILVPLHLAEGEIDDLVAFLESLSAEPLPMSLLSPPSLPPTP